MLVLCKSLKEQTNKKRGSSHFPYEISIIITKTGQKHCEKKRKLYSGLLYEYRCTND